MCKSGSRTALQQFATDFLHRFSFLLLSRQKNPARKRQAAFPLVYFTLPSIKALYPIKVDGIMSCLRPFRGVLWEEEHSGKVLLFVCKWERKFFV